MSATIKYNGSTIASVEDGASVELDTQGKYMSGNVTVEAAERESGWKRPSEWPDYSKLHLVDDGIEAEFFTFDNREATLYGVQTNIGLYAKCSVTTAGVIRVDRVNINNDGSIDVLDTATYNQHTNIGISIPLDAGDYVCYRLTPVSGHITGIAMSLPQGWATAYRMNQKCVERFGNLPYCSGFHPHGAASRSWGCANLVSDTILSMAQEVSEIDYEFSHNLVNLPMAGWTTVKKVGFRDCMQLQSIDFNKLDLSECTNISYMFTCSGFSGNVDLSSQNLSKCTNILALFGSTGGGSRNMVTIRFPTGLNNVTNSTDCLNGATSLQVIEIDGTLNQSTAGIGTRFCPNKQVKALILRGETVCPLLSTSNIGFLAVGCGHVFVPESILASYKAATNWSTYADYILPIEGSYWETHHADGSLIEEEA